MRRIVLLAPLAVAALIVFACSSSGSSGGGGGSSSYSLTNCPGNPLATSSAACISCVESSCASQIAAVNTACASLFACACPAGADAAACSSSVLPDVGITPCGEAIGTASAEGQAGTGFFGCAISSCSTPCTPADGG